MVFLKELFEKIDFEKNQQTTEKPEKLLRMQIVKVLKWSSFATAFNMFSNECYRGDGTNSFPLDLNINTLAEKSF